MSAAGGGLSHRPAVDTWGWAAVVFACWLVGGHSRITQGTRFN